MPPVMLEKLAFTVAVVVSPNASVTVHVKVVCATSPLTTLDCVNVVVALVGLLTTGDAKPSKNVTTQLYVYGAVPPTGVTVQGGVVIVDDGAETSMNDGLVLAVIAGENVATVRSVVPSASMTFARKIVRNVDPSSTFIAATVRLTLPASIMVMVISIRAKYRPPTCRKGLRRRSLAGTPARLSGMRCCGADTRPAPYRSGWW